MVTRVWLVGIALIVLTMAGVGLTIADMYRRTIQDSRHDMANLGAALAEQTSRYVQVIDLVLQDVQAHDQSMGIRTPDQFATRLSGPDTRAYLVARLKNLPQAHAIMLVGADGALVNASRNFSLASYNVAGRDYFRHFRDGNARGLFVSAPAIGYASGLWTVFLVRRIAAPDGAFLGVVVVAVDVQYLLDFYRSISRHETLAVTLLRRDGIILARYSDARNVLGKRIPSASAWYGLAARGGGTFRSPGYLSGKRSVIAVTPLRDYPLVVDVAISEHDALDMWRRQAIFVSAVELAVVAAFVVLFGVIARQVRRFSAQHADLQRVTQALRQSQSRLTDFARTASDWFWEQDTELRFTEVGREAPMLEPADRSYIGKLRWEATETSRVSGVWDDHIRDVTSHKPFSDFRYARIANDGTVRHISVSGVPVHDDAGMFAGYRGTGRDVTAGVEAEQQLRAAKERAEQAEKLLQDAIDSLSEGLVVYDRDDRLVMCNGTYRTRYRINAGNMDAGTQYSDILRHGLIMGQYPEAIGREKAWLADWMQQHSNLPLAVEVPLTDGRWLLVTEGRMSNGGVAGLRIDITALKQTQAALCESEARLDRAQQIARLGSWECDVASGRCQWSKEMYRIRGLSADEYEPALDTLLQTIHAEDRPAVRTWLADLKCGIERESIEFRIVRPDGETRIVSVEGRPVHGPDGTIRKLTGTTQDITERRLIEQQLVQAQKMEAIGNLTGGMAHDFNNLLGVIIGNLYLLSETLDDDGDRKELCTDALQAADRGADLTRRLLAFGRRQFLHPQATDINHLVSETTKLLTRMLGSDITVELRLAEKLRPTIVDPVQLETALTNLVTNARDAMPKGGKLTIATAVAHLDAAYASLHPDVVPGGYKLIEVTDTGTGMPLNVKARMFDPFFTTKPQGKGTGLGLSMVFGFIKQSGGHVSVYSEPGHGTTVRLYLPYRAANPAAVAAPVPASPVLGGTETILLVEDDAAVRRIVARQLAELGYVVTEAISAAAALDVLDRGIGVDLLLTDVVMPGPMDGIELAAAAALRRPGLRALLMSGFPEARFEQRGEEQVRPPLISKPFHRDELAVALRAVLDATAAAGAAVQPMVDAN